MTRNAATPVCICVQLMGCGLNGESGRHVRFPVEEAQNSVLESVMDHTTVAPAVWANLNKEGLVIGGLVQVRPVTQHLFLAEQTK